MDVSIIDGLCEQGLNNIGRLVNFAQAYPVLACHVKRLQIRVPPKVRSTSGRCSTELLIRTNRSCFPAGEFSDYVWRKHCGTRKRLNLVKNVFFLNQRLLYAPLRNLKEIMEGGINTTVSYIVTGQAVH